MPHFHLVFTLPHEINPLAQGNPKGLLFQAASETLQRFGRDPKWLVGEIGIAMVLHTWGRNLSQHLHVHCVVSGGALAPDGRWIPPSAPTRSEHSLLSLGPPAHPLWDARLEPLASPLQRPLPTAAGHVAPTPPIDPFPPVDHNSS